LNLTTFERIYWLPSCYNFVNSGGKQEYHSLNIPLDQPPYLQSTEQVPFFSNVSVFTDQSAQTWSWCTHSNSIPLC